jgi:uncharacterized membrane protein SpoIIM required for sporulation
MRERQFIAQNKEKWKAFETLLQSKDKDPERLGELFVQITDDLSYARTFYPNRSVRVYLNKLAQQVFHELYQIKAKKKNRLQVFLLDEIPSAVFHARKELLLSLILFVVSMGIGVFSAINDPDFAKSILSEQYVAMTESNIEKDDPMAVYKGDNQFFVFTYIAQNNLSIDVRTFVSGLFFGIWTIIMLVYNGIMVGAFQYFFIERNLFVESFLTIWMHGTLELSAAVVAGGAGLILGRGIVFPGTYSRLQSLIIAAKEGLKIFLIAIVMTTFAAFIESFVTRYTEIHDFIRFLWILLCFAFVIGYFMVLPYLKNKKGLILKVSTEKLSHNFNHNIVLDTPKNIGTLFSDAFATYRETIAQYLPLAFGLALLYAIGNVLVNYNAIYQTFQFEMDRTYGFFAPVHWTFLNMSSIFSFYTVDFKVVLNTLLLSTVIYFSVHFGLQYLIKNQQSSVSFNKIDRMKLIFQAVALAVLLQFMAFIPGAAFWIFVLSPIPFLLIALFTYNLNHPTQERVDIFKTSIWPGIGLFHSIILISTVLFTLITYTVFEIFFQFMQMILDLESLDYYKIYVGIYIFFSSFALLLVLPPIIYGFMFLYFSARERVTANGLRNRMQFLHQKEKEDNAA